MYHCLRYNDDPEKMRDCWQRKEDEHCFYCCFYQPDKSERVISNEDLVDITRRVMQTFLDTAKIAMKKV